MFYISLHFSFFSLYQEEKLYKNNLLTQLSTSALKTK